MKRVCIILIFSVLVLAVNAQNYFGVSLGLLTTYQLDNVDNTTARLGGGGEIGAIYQLQRNNFLFQTGLGLNYSVSILGVDSMPLSANMIDTEGATFTYKGIVYDRVDRANVTELSVPLMLGFNISSFYALIGAKFVYPLMTTTRQTALLTTYGDYNGMFYEDFFDMPQHGYANAQPAKTIGQTDFSYDVRACVELGGRWSLSGKKSLSSQLQVGLFAEYGVLNTLKGGNNNLVDVDYSKYMSVKMNHIYTTLSPSLASVYNLRIGLRASLLFPVADFNSKHKKCMCIVYVNRKHSVYRKRR